MKVTDTFNMNATAEPSRINGIGNVAKGIVKIAAGGLGTIFTDAYTLITADPRASYATYRYIRDGVDDISKGRQEIREAQSLQSAPKVQPTIP